MYMADSAQNKQQHKADAARRMQKTLDSITVMRTWHAINANDIAGHSRLLNTQQNARA
jgi:hypothetical protein